MDLPSHFITDNPTAAPCFFPDNHWWSLPGHVKPVGVQLTERYDGEEKKNIPGLAGRPRFGEFVRENGDEGFGLRGR